MESTLKGFENSNSITETINNIPGIAGEGQSDGRGKNNNEILDMQKELDSLRSTLKEMEQKIQNFELGPIW